MDQTQVLQLRNVFSASYINLHNKNCHILLGVNESGKSNILKALYLKNPTQDEPDYYNGELFFMNIVCLKG
jgi:AAA15 family ATPase/GTPase